LKLAKEQALALKQQIDQKNEEIERQIAE